MHRSKPMCWLALVIIVGSGELLAKTYKCTDPSGNISYSQTACANVKAEREEVRIIRTAPSADTELCTSAQHYATDIHPQIISSQNSAEIFQQFGGINAVPTGLLNLINYVYSLRMEPNITAQRAGTLVYAKCLNGGFGTLTLNDFPVDSQAPSDNFDTDPPPNTNATEE